jgi:Uma2 family endonuclease
MSPAPKRFHQRYTGNAYYELRQKVTSGEVVVSPSDVHLDEGVIVQPDVFWVSGANSLCKPGDDGYWYGAPDLVVEVLSSSTVSRDRGRKYALYERYGVREYWLIDPDGEYIEVYRREDDRFVRFGLFVEGETFPFGLLPDVTISVAALFQ